MDFSQPGVRQACVFDAYGTLFDTTSAVASAEAPPDKTGALSRLWRQKQLQYTWLRSLEGRHADFRQVTADALDYALETLGIETGEVREKLLEGYRTLKVFPEAPEVLERLRGKGLRTAILSNGTREMLEELAEHAGISGLLDEVLSVEEVGVYKPHPKVYQLAADRLGLPAARIAFVSSNGWDAWAAAAFGMRVAWCNRHGEPPERLPGKPQYEVKSLAELPWL